MAKTKYWVWLSSINLGSAVRQKLLDIFGDPEKIFFAEREELAAVGLERWPLEQLCDKSMERTADILSACQEQGIGILTVQDADYPERLRQIADPPAVLYIKGTLPETDELACVGVVGTRHCTPYGQKMALRLGGQIAAEGGVVVSGLAMGVDSAAMEGALRAGGTVIGVLGTAINEIFPKSAKNLFAAAEQCGAVISEYPPGMRTQPWNFKERNRIISGLSLGVVVVEAPKRSGSLVTARHALEQNRDVFVVPGNADVPACVGSNGLLLQGALAVTDGKQVMAQYQGAFRPVTGKKAPIQLKKEIDKNPELLYIDLVEKMQGLPEEQRAVAEAIGGECLLSDDITAKTGLPAAKVTAALTMLEIGGWVRQENGKRYRLVEKKG